MSAKPPPSGAAGGSPKTRAEAAEIGLVRLADAVAERIEERLDERQRARAGWVTADVVAAHLSVDVDWVYAHADELGGIRLGDGPKARRRFKLATVDAALEATASCHRGRTPEAASSGGAEPKPRRRRAAGSGRVPNLLPVRQPRGG